MESFLFPYPRTLSKLFTSKKSKDYVSCLSFAKFFAYTCQLQLRVTAYIGNFPKSQSLYSRGYPFIFSAYFFKFSTYFFIILQIFHLPSYSFIFSSNFPHIPPYFSHIPSYSLIFLHIFHIKKEGSEFFQRVLL